MKFRRLVLLLVFLLLLAAWYTRPSGDEFKTFYRSQMTVEGPPVIEFSDKFLYTTADVNFYTAARIDPAQSLKAVSIKKESYLGLFGRFWKL